MKGGCCLAPEATDLHAASLWLSSPELVAFLCAAARPSQEQSSPFMPRLRTEVSAPFAAHPWPRRAAWEEGALAGAGCLGRRGRGLEEAQASPALIQGASRLKIHGSPLPIASPNEPGCREGAKLCACRPCASSLLAAPLSPFQTCRADSL